MKEDIKVLEELTERFEKEYPYCNIWGDEIQAIENLIKGYKELEEKAYKKEYYEEVADELYKNSISKSKVKEILDRYAYTSLDDVEKVIRFYKDLQELL